jgi:hypothetical protein
MLGLARAVGALLLRHGVVYSPGALRAVCVTESDAAGPTRVEQMLKQAWKARKSSSQLGRLGRLAEKPCDEGYVCNVNAGRYVGRHRGAALGYTGLHAPHAYP